MSMRINDYEYETLLGRGTFGSVYLVRRKKDGKPFVVKEQSLDTENATSFKIALEEIQCFRKTRHPNIVAYHGGWLENNYSYILMEYATRCTLKDLLDARGSPLNETDALYLFSQIVLGVHHIHLNKILHRDLKPENIMLTGSRGDIVKIGDFGVSKNLQELKNRQTMCRAGSFNYMSPEMLAGQPYDFKSDVWSMGVVLYEMVTKTVPFPAKTYEEIVVKIWTERPQALRIQLSRDFVSLLSKMLRKQPMDRPNAGRLILCPHLVPYISKVHLNLGRTVSASNRGKEIFRPDIFLKFLKSS